jgi:hypothetical protein
MGNYTFWIGNQVDDPKAQKILEIIDFTRFGEDEQFVYSQWGKPDVHFEWEGTPWASKPLPFGFEKVDPDYPKVGGFGTGYPVVYTSERFPFINTEDLSKFYEEVWIRGGNGIGKTLAQRTYKYDVANETGYAEVNKRYGDTLATIEDTFYFDAIMGKIDIDSAWDAYVADWRKNGGDEILAELAKAPIISEFLSGNLAY